MFLIINKNLNRDTIDTLFKPIKKHIRTWSFDLPTHDEIKASKAHLKEVDNAQEFILEAMFDDLRSNYEYHFKEKKTTDTRKSFY